MSEHKVVICPECGSPMVLRRTQKFKWRSGEGRLFYGCSRWPECKAVHGAHPDGRPLGIPADQETKAARIAAHEAMDQLVASRGWGIDSRDPRARRGLYMWLGRKLGMAEEDIKDKCHVALFDKPTCEKVVLLCRQAMERDKLRTGVN